MGKFVLMLIFIFVLLYVGGSLLFDSGIADSKGISRVPLAVEVEKGYRLTNKYVSIAGKKAAVVVVPAVQKVFYFMNPQN